MLVLQLQTAPGQLSHNLFKTLNIEIVYLLKKTQEPSRERTRKISENTGL